MALPRRLSTAGPSSRRPSAGAHQQAPRPTSRHSFEVAIICALPLEADAVHALFDTYWDDDLTLDKAAGDPNAYSLGAIGRHNVVLVHMPGMGKVEAATVSASCRVSFPGIKLALLVGICGVVPFSSDREIILGDVIVGDGIVQYDFGRRLSNRFLRKDTLSDSLGRPNTEVRALLAKLKGLRAREVLQHKMATNLETLQANPSLAADYPGTEHDNLFEADPRTESPCDQSSCQCKIVLRRRLETVKAPEPLFHVGTIASGDSVMKSGSTRDSIAASEDIIAFEMEGAGIWDAFPCLVIKGACDYADSHKSKGWQRYAAATAAAFSKALLSFWTPSLPIVPVISQMRVSQDTTHHIPFPKNRRFVERKGVMYSLTQLLFEDNEPRVALVGLGGMGKTQLALQLAHWVKDNMQDYSVFWIPALSMATFEQACGEIVKKLVIQCTDGDDPKTSVQQHLSSGSAGNWLLILDNADDKSTLYESQEYPFGIDDFLPDSNGGRILVTTRSQEVAVNAAGSAVVRLSGMSRDESTSLLKKSLICKDELQNESLVAELLQTLTNLPLAISQAAAYMNINQVSMEDYLRLFRNTDNDMIELLSRQFRDRTHYHTSQGAVAATWTISFNQIHDNHPLAARLLSFIAYIEPKAIPRSILPESETDQQMTQAIGTLRGYGFLTQQGNAPVFDMHSLVHLAIRIWIEDQDTADSVRQMTVAHLARIFPSDKWENRQLWRQYLPHALRILGAASNFDRDICDLGFWVGGCLHKDGRTQEAVRVLEQVATAQKHLPHDDPGRLSSQHALALSYASNGQVQEAIDLLEHIVTIKGEFLQRMTYLVTIKGEFMAEDDLSRLASQHVLARSYESNGQVQEAIDLLEHIVVIEEEVLAEDHPNRLKSRHALAKAYTSNGQIQEAIDLIKSVVAIQKEGFAENHPDRLASEYLLASAYYSDGQCERTIQLLEHIVAVERGMYPEGHPSRQVSQQLLLDIYADSKYTQKDSLEKPG
ncbi:hypothetical protein NM208_g666 [Fusarium decemcellulare]|uniref:Uncharacterized protein n=1 Tax=Fusarium decemcellulare TaxID=57161 RepID=A0ACC1SZ02_9HYPO|nr:hypothetical protein NM208_g666 [Fusarium decemcellulare]